MDYAYFVAFCVEFNIDLEWADKQNPYVLLNVARHLNKMRGSDKKDKRKATAADMKDFVK